MLCAWGTGRRPAGQQPAAPTGRNHGSTNEKGQGRLQQILSPIIMVLIKLNIYRIICHVSHGVLNLYVNNSFNYLDNPKRYRYYYYPQVTLRGPRLREIR